MSKVMQQGQLSFGTDRKFNETTYLDQKRFHISYKVKNVSYIHTGSMLYV